MHPGTARLLPSTSEALARNGDASDKFIIVDGSEYCLCCHDYPVWGDAEYIAKNKNPNVFRLLTWDSEAAAMAVLPYVKAWSRVPTGTATVDVVRPSQLQIPLTKLNSASADSLGMPIIELLKKNTHGVTEALVKNGAVDNWILVLRAGQRDQSVFTLHTNPTRTSLAHCGTLATSEHWRECSQLIVWNSRDKADEFAAERWGDSYCFAHRLAEYPELSKLSTISIDSIQPALLEALVKNGVPNRPWMIVSPDRLNHQLLYDIAARRYTWWDTPHTKVVVWPTRADAERWMGPDIGDEARPCTDTSNTVRYAELRYYNRCESAGVSRLTEVVLRGGACQRYAITITSPYPDEGESCVGLIGHSCFYAGVATTLSLKVLRSADTRDSQYERVLYWKTRDSAQRAADSYPRSKVVDAASLNLAPEWFVPVEDYAHILENVDEAVLLNGQRGRYAILDGATEKMCLVHAPSFGDSLHWLTPRFVDGTNWRTVVWPNVAAAQRYINSRMPAQSMSRGKIVDIADIPIDPSG